MRTSCGGFPVPAASSSETTIVPACSCVPSKSTSIEKVPRKPVPQVEVVKPRDSSVPPASSTLTVTFASKTFALPETVMPLSTR